MTNWIFPKSTTPIPDGPDRYLPVWTVMPNWKDGVLERLAWLTDVMVSERAVEQRRSVRRYPRRSFEASFMRTEANRSRLDNFVTAIGRGRFLVPLFHEQYKLVGQQPGTSTQGRVRFPAGSLQYREFHVDDMVLITTGDPTRFTICTVTERNEMTDTIALKHITDTTTWPEGSRIIPLRVARLLDSPKMDNPSDRVGLMSLRFDLSDADTTFEPSWGYCAPLWRFKPHRKQEITLDYERADFTLDMQGGVIEVSDPSKRAQVSQSFMVRFFGRESTWAYRAFLYAARGRAQRFYLPTFLHDIQPTSDLGGFTFNSRANGFSQYVLEPQEARRIIAIAFADGAPTIYRNVVSVAPVVDAVAPYNTIFERFTVDVELPPIPMKNIERVSFVAPVRFDQDTFELQHATDESVAVTSSVVMRASVVAGMPPIECWVTSKMYPLEDIEAYRGSAFFIGGRLYDPNAYSGDTYTGDAAFTGGTLESVLSGYEGPPEAYTTAAIISDGTLRELLHIGYGAVDALDVAGQMTEGAIRVALLVYSNYPAEALDITAQLTEGTLT